MLVASVLEAAVLWRRVDYDWRATGVSMLDLVMRVGMQIFLPLSIATPLIALAYQHRLTTIPLDGRRRCWRSSSARSSATTGITAPRTGCAGSGATTSVHHSPNQLNLSAAYRIGIFGRLTGTPLFFVPLVWLGFPPKVVFEVLSLNLLYQFWIHATWIPRLGWLEGVLNTPSAHRVHHAANLDYLDANYGGVLIVFDRLFGTYLAERDDLPCRYGLVTPLLSHNPLRVEFHQWLALARDLAAARSLRALFGALLMPPGWKAEGPGETTEDLRRRAAQPAHPSATAPSAPVQAAASGLR